MKRKLAGIFFALLSLLVASSLVFADSSGRPVDPRTLVSSPPAAEVNFTAKLIFDSDMDDHVRLQISNHGKERLVIAPQAYYIDQIGSAGSHDCTAGSQAFVGAGTSRYVEFKIGQAAAHGPNSILAFFFRYEGDWYLAKVGENNGVEYFLQHN